MKKNSVILVTGGAGFIGSNLCMELVKAGFENIISLDNYSTGSEKNHISGVTYIRANTKDINKELPGNVDTVFHLGEYSRVEQSFREFEKVWNANIAGTRAVVEFCKDKGAKLIYAGSSTKFGDGGLGRSQTPYGWTKAVNTELVQNYSEWFGLQYAITYFYNAYGEMEIETGPYATVIGIFANCMKAGKELPVVLPGTQLRNFTHVKDIVSGLIVVAKEGEGDGYGIGSDQAYSIIDVAEMFGGDVTYLESRRGNRMGADVVSEKTKELGWRPKYSLEQYIEDLKLNFLGL